MQPLPNEHADETIRRLRDLNGVMELSLRLAADSLAESVDEPKLTSEEWFEMLLRSASRRLEEHGRVSGRWAFFTDHEIFAISLALDVDAARTERVMPFSGESVRAEIRAEADARADRIVRD